MTGKIRVNGEWKPHEAGDLAELLTSLGITSDRRGVAVAVNGEVVRRAAWPDKSLHPGDEVEIIEAAQGG